MLINLISWIRNRLEIIPIYEQDAVLQDTVQNKHLVNGNSSTINVDLILDISFCFYPLDTQDVTSWARSVPVLPFETALIVPKRKPPPVWSIFFGTLSVVVWINFIAVFLILIIL